MKINTKVLFSILSGESKSLSVIIKALFLFCLEYIFGILFLILSLFFILNFKNQVISVGVVLIVIIFGISAVGFIYQYGVKHKLFRIKQYIRGLLLETPFGINPPVHKIKDYYELAQKWKIEKEWKKVVLKNNPSYQDKDFER